MDKDTILLEELNIETLYGDGGTTYEVPIYQRNYAWEKDQIETLIQDIYDAYTANPQKVVYYIGTLVIFDRGGKVYEVIDGQQRLTTIYLVLNALNLALNTFGALPKSKLTYRARRKSKDTLDNIVKPEKTGNPDRGILNGFVYAQNAIYEIVAPAEREGFYSYFLNNVHILRYIVPKDIDLNHYFEVMNSRGEQLEMHEIVKASLCSGLSPDEMEKFAYIWEACSQMNIYIQQRLNDTAIFGTHLNECPDIDFDRLPSPQDKSKGKISIRDLAEGNIGVLTEDTGNDRNDTFQPVIDFPNFLLIVLKITRMDEEQFDPVKFILDDKELINEFNKARRDSAFAKQFIMNLLKARFLLDNFIVHHSNNEDSFGDNPWQLQLYVKEMYPKNTADDNKTQDELVQLLSMFEVAFTARQRKNWLFYCLLHLFNDTDPEHYLHFLRALAKKYFFDIYLNPGNLSESNNRPIPNSFDNTILRNREIMLEIDNRHPDFDLIYGNGTQASKGVQLYIFNYTDYILWSKYASEIRGKGYGKDNRERIAFFESLGCSDFGLDTFDNFYFSRTRKSLEHFYPQAKAVNGSELSRDNINCFGNYAMIGADANSSGSNWNPKAKLAHYRDRKQDQVSVASLKFKIMMQICDDNCNKISRNELCRHDGMEWNFDDIANHQKKMLSILFSDL